jgi:hypothetical protein
MSDPQLPRPRRRRREVCFGLALAVVVGLALAIGQWSRQARVQRRIVELVDAGGGYVAYDEIADDTHEPSQEALERNFERLQKSLGHPATAKEEQPRRSVGEWLRRILGDDFFGSVVCIQSFDPSIGDSALTGLGDLPRLQDVTLSSPRIGDPSVAEIGKLRRLKTLKLWGSEIGDAGLKRIAQINSLEYLDLSDSPQLTDAGLAHLARLGKLKTLLLNQINVTDAGLEYLRGMKDLDELYLYHTKVTPEGVARLKRLLPQLKVKF